MIKKIFLLVFISIFILSCGKKDDPIYEQPKSKKTSTKINVVL